MNSAYKYLSQLVGVYEFEYVVKESWKCCGNSSNEKLEGEGVGRW